MVFCFFPVLGQNFEKKSSGAPATGMEGVCSRWREHRLPDYQKAYLWNRKGHHPVSGKLVVGGAFLENLPQRLEDTFGTHDETHIEDT